MYINLHTHSVFSDGILGIKELISEAKKRNVIYLSITDHDTVNGYRDLNSELNGIHIINGVEISTRNHDYLHILGYGIDVFSSSLEVKLKLWRERRLERVSQIIDKLKKIGIDISLDDLDVSLLTTIGRPHIADVLVKRGYGSTRNDVFYKYLVEGKPAYVSPMGPDLKEAIETIKDAGGFTILAHPGSIEGAFDIEELVRNFDGIEVFYPAHTSSMIKRYLSIAKKYNLIVTAGTDYHGPGTTRDLMDYYIFDKEELLNIERVINGR